MSIHLLLFTFLSLTVMTYGSDDFYNKPWGLKHWLDSANPPIKDGVVVALIDPDMIFVRPLTPQIRGLGGNEI